MTDQMWSDYLRDGFVRLGAVLDQDEIVALRERADALAAGRVSNPGVQPAAVVNAPLGALSYRTIQGLETDERFSPLVRHPLFLEIAARHYGPHAPIATFRATIVDKPADRGTTVRWHQNGGDVRSLDRDPLVTIWVALDSATVANGCVEVIPGSHTLGLLGAPGGALADEDAARHCVPDRVFPLEVEAGHAVLMHNWLIHRSGVNPSARPRRVFSACYMDGRTMNTLTGRYFPILAGAAPEPHHFLREQLQQAALLQTRLDAAEEYSDSLHEDNVLLRRSRDEATAYALSLERAIEGARRQREDAQRYARSLEAERDANLARSRG